MEEPFTRSETGTARNGTRCDASVASAQLVEQRDERGADLRAGMIL
jgi:hypothetical protein